VLLPGIEDPQTIFEIIGRASQVPAEKQKLRAAYELGLAAYRTGDLPAARRHFCDCLSMAPEDGPTRTILERIETLPATSATNGSWSGVWRLNKDDLP
jgi:hypothetical protein